MQSRSLLLSTILASSLFLTALDADASDLFSSLKKLQDTVTQSSENGGSTGIGDLLKDLAPKTNSTKSSNNDGSANTNGTSTTSKIDDVASSNSTINLICKRTAKPNIYKKLEKPNIANLEKTFGKSKNQIDKILKTELSSSIPFLSSLELIKYGFDTQEGKELFQNFVASPNMTDFSIMLETSKKQTFSADAKKVIADASFAFGVVNYFYANNGANIALADKFIKAAAKQGQYGATYVEGMRWYMGDGRARKVKNAVSWMRKSYDKASKRSSEPLATLIQNDFLKIVADPNYENRDIYADLIAQSQEMKANLEAQLAVNDPSVSTLFVDDAIELTNRRAALLIELGNVFGLGNEVEAFKAALKEMDREASSASLVAEKKIKTDSFQSLIEKQMGKVSDLDDQALARLQDLHSRNGEYVSLAHSTLFAFTAASMASGLNVESLLNMDTIKLSKALGGMKKSACDVNNGIIDFGAKTNFTITPSNAVVSEKLQRPSRKKKKS